MFSDLLSRQQHTVTGSVTGLAAKHKRRIRGRGRGRGLEYAICLGARHQSTRAHSTSCVAMYATPVVSVHPYPALHLLCVGRLGFRYARRLQLVGKRQNHIRLRTHKKTLFIRWKAHPVGANGTYTSCQIERRPRSHKNFWNALPDSQIGQPI